MKLTDILIGFEVYPSPFPSEGCTKPSPAEKGVFDSEEVYLCVVRDMRFPHRFEMRILSPYTAVSLEGDGLVYAWTDGFSYVDHVERPVHLDHEQVVAWRRVYEDAPVFQFPQVATCP